MRAVRGHKGKPKLVDVDEAPGRGELISMRVAGICVSIGYCGHAGQREMRLAAEMLAGRPEIAESLITHRFALEDAAEAFA